MIISWITSKGASMGKLDDGLEQKLLDFCINHHVKPLNEQELKQYIPIQYISPKTDDKPQNTVPQNAQIVERKKHWWKK